VRGSLARPTATAPSTAPGPQARRAPPDEGKAAYGEILARWLPPGRRPLHAPAAVGDPAAPPPLTVAGLILAYWPHAELHYRDADGNPTGELTNVRCALRPLRELYEPLPAAELSPLKLKAVRDRMRRGG